MIPQPADRIARLWRGIEFLLSAALSQPAVIAVLTWELADKYSWLRDPK